MKSIQRREGRSEAANVPMNRGYDYVWMNIYEDVGDLSICRGKALGAKRHLVIHSFMCACLFVFERRRERR